MTERDTAITDCLRKCRETLESHGEHKLVDYIDFVLNMGDTQDTTRTPTVLRFVTWDGQPSWCVACSPDEWHTLIAPAKTRGIPIDGSTVDEFTLSRLLDRPEVVLPLGVPVDFELELV